MYSTYDTSFFAGLGALLIGIVIFALIILAAAIVIQCFYFKKVGRKAWEGIIPFYCNWCLVEAAGLEKYWFFLTLAPIAGSILAGIPILGALISLACTVISLIAQIAIYYNLNKRLGKETVWTVMAMLIGPIYMAIVAFSSSITFDATMAVNPDGPFENLANSIKGMFGKNNDSQPTQPAAPVQPAAEPVAAEPIVAEPVNTESETTDEN